MERTDRIFAGRDIPQRVAHVSLRGLYPKRSKGLGTVQKALLVIEYPGDDVAAVVCPTSAMKKSSTRLRLMF
jgi:hypothetical protein